MQEESSQAANTGVMHITHGRSVLAIRRIVCLLISIAVLASDQITKNIIKTTVAPGRVITVIPGFFNIIHTENSGIAFSLFAGASSSWKMVLLIAISVALLAAVVVVALKSREISWVTGIGLALILGGAASNLLDRIRFGLVVDFLDVYYRSYHWPTFNVADSSIVVGAGLLLVELFIVK